MAREKETPANGPPEHDGNASGGARTVHEMHYGEVENTWENEEEGWLSPKGVVGMMVAGWAEKLAREVPKTAAKPAVNMAGIVRPSWWKKKKIVGRKKEKKKGRGRESQLVMWPCLGGAIPPESDHGRLL